MKASPDEIEDRLAELETRVTAMETALAENVVPAITSAASALIGLAEQVQALLEKLALEGDGPRLVN